MAFTGLTIAEDRFMHSVISNTNRIADALEEANKIRNREVELKEKELELLTTLNETLRWLK